MLNEFKNNLINLKNSALSQIDLSQSTADLVNLKTKIMGRKSELNSILKLIGNESENDKKKLGEFANEIRSCLNSAFETKLNSLKQIERLEKMKLEKIDVTLPGRTFKLGHIHPLTQVTNEIVSIFEAMSFNSVDGPEIETDYYNFEALNIPKNHPARNTQDTFYVKPPELGKPENWLLRTQTSSVQIHIMENSSPPIKIISPGRVFRSDSVDATHSPIFHQLEGLFVDKNVSLANLKHTLETFVNSFYGPKVKTRFRPHHFPFTEPSAEMDVSCFACGGEGCSLCKNEGFIEILGCGMVHRDVLSRCNIDPDVFSGFAFGFGIERLAMMQYKINDLRLFYENDLNFLTQF